MEAFLALFMGLEDFLRPRWRVARWVRAAGRFWSAILPRWTRWRLITAGTSRRHAPIVRPFTLVPRAFSRLSSRTGVVSHQALTSSGFWRHFLTESRKKRLEQRRAKLKTVALSRQETKTEPCEKHVNWHPLVPRSPFSVRELHFLPLSQAQPARKTFLTHWMPFACHTKNATALYYTRWKSIEPKTNFLGLRTSIGWNTPQDRNINWMQKRNLVKTR